MEIESMKEKIKSDVIFAGSLATSVLPVRGLLVIHYTSNNEVNVVLTANDMLIQLDLDADWNKKPRLFVTGSIKIGKDQPFYAIDVALYLRTILNDMIENENIKKVEFWRPEYDPLLLILDVTLENEPKIVNDNLKFKKVESLHSIFTI